MADVQIPLDVLAPAVRKILDLEPAAYSRLVVTGDGTAQAKMLLTKLTPLEVFTPGTLRSDADRKAILAGLWLWHDWLDRSHTLSQSLSSPTGSFWHAIMHRREGDFSNSKYWYARVGGHPALAILANQAGAIVNRLPADKALLRIVATGWNPDALVDLAEEVHDKPSDSRYDAAVRLQQLEWRVLFDQCARG